MTAMASTTKLDASGRAVHTNTPVAVAEQRDVIGARESGRSTYASTVHITRSRGRRRCPFRTPGGPSAGAIRGRFRSLESVLSAPGHIAEAELNPQRGVAPAECEPRARGRRLPQNPHSAARRAFPARSSVPADRYALPRCDELFVYGSRTPGATPGRHPADTNAPSIAAGCDGQGEQVAKDGATRLADFLTGLATAVGVLVAVALIAVITYHFNTEWLPGAYWSIDFFFVLSGFLITALLLKEFERKDRVDLVAFWGRRFRRLMPVALLVICAVAVWALLINDPLVSRQVRGDGLGAMTYVLNLKYVVTGSSYFESFLTPSPLRHMWSLSLEEQWYAVWPLALWAVLGRGGIRAAKRAVPVLLSLAAAGAILMAYLVHDAADPSRVYYGSDTRSQALFVGAALQDI